ncbi:Protein tyrosine/serine phosphatase [Labilithrix luteola]|uniref:diphosphoinositol-polyphosphate diphosphatase n=1 Tax=Labilithrix luteola TaxID=1391654 RepID=A0A0K1PVL3_9BACT|nr:tyrosine-protein phosphatase [Labilithrix luteola]AKU97164.1 Protein tyrosine/serine phosphatase [Labilithrix luteola]
MNLKRLCSAGLLVGAALVGMVGCASPQGDDVGDQSAAVDSAPMMNFVKVRDGLYRGGHPDAAGLDYLKKLGVKTIIDLEIGDLIEARPRDIDTELAEAQARGIRVVREPMAAYTPAVSDAFDAKIEEALSILKDPAQGPVYVHCLHGQDRTGLVIGLERVFVEGWDPGDAYAEMLSRGFHTYYLGLNHYFETKTGFED